MRKIISGLLIGLLFMGCAKQETTYTIQGEWEGGDGKVVYLKKDLGDKKYEIQDSVVVANGSFKMQKPLGDVDERILEINGSTNIIILDSVPIHVKCVTVKKTVKGIVTNPILIGIVAGLVWSALKIPMPAIPKKVISSIGNVATPMGLMAMGATFDIKKAFGKIKPSAIAAFMKLIGLCAIFLPIAVKLGFRTDKLVAILIMLGSATTVSSFVMAKNMGHEGTLSSSVVMLTTMFSAFTVTGWLYILRHFMLI